MTKHGRRKEIQEDVMENTGLKFSQHDRSWSSTECIRVMFVTSSVICFSLDVNYTYIQIHISYIYPAVWRFIIIGKKDINAEVIQTIERIVGTDLSEVCHDSDYLFSIFVVTSEWSTLCTGAGPWSWCTCPGRWRRGSGWRRWST